MDHLASEGAAVGVAELTPPLPRAQMALGDPPRRVAPLHSETPTVYGKPSWD